MKVIGEIQRTASVETVTWKPDGRHVAIGCSDGMVAVVNVESQTIAGEVVRGMPFIQDDKKKKTISRDSCHVNAICWSPDGQFLAIAGSDNCCAIVETGTFVLLHEIRRSGIVTCIDWRERRLLTGDEGRYLAVGGDDRAVAIMKTGVMNDEEESNSVADSDHSGASSSYFSIGSGSSISQHEWVLREDSFRDIEEVESFSHATAFAVSSTLDTAHSNTVVAAVSFSKHRKGDPSKYLVIAYSNGCVTIFDTGDLRHVAKVRILIVGTLTSVIPRHSLFFL
jgi:WD40 repeat protein